MDCCEPSFSEYRLPWGGVKEDPWVWNLLSTGCNKDGLGEGTVRADKFDVLDKETGALRPDVFNFLFEHELKRSHSFQYSVALLILEPDRTRLTSETLQKMAALLQKEIREVDLLGRIGDATFAILLPQSDLDGAYIVASRIVDHVSNYVFPQEQGQHLTVSVGAGCFPTTSASLETADLFKTAQNALKVAKKEGNSVYLAGPSFRRPRKRRVANGSGSLF